MGRKGNSYRFMKSFRVIIDENHIVDIELNSQEKIRDKKQLNLLKASNAIQKEDHQEQKNESETAEQSPKEIQNADQPTNEENYFADPMNFSDIFEDSYEVDDLFFDPSQDILMDNSFEIF